jgi:hypothetical protein
MPRDMTERDVAEWILEILVKELDLKAEDYVPDHKLKDGYRARGGDSADITVGLKYAEASGWLKYDNPKDTWQLTTLGYEYA